MAKHHRHKKATLEDMRAQRDDMQQQRDKWQQQAERLVLADATTKRSWWTRLAG